MVPSSTSRGSYFLLWDLRTVAAFCLHFVPDIDLFFKLKRKQCFQVLYTISSIIKTPGTTGLIVILCSLMGEQIADLIVFINNNAELLISFCSVKYLHEHSRFHCFNI